ncbi:hypothetical protein [Actinomadura sp. GTD37]|uniref:hypothetical protein n=1 Tax=Actinomadura sp. GTD37 TaxID=1778030 RepID=UPI0035C26D79
MSDLTVYRTTHPAVLTHRNRHNRTLTQWRRNATQLLTDLGFPGRTWIVGTAFGDRWIVGITPRDDIELPLRGWRRTRFDARDVFVPDRRTRGGKLIAAQMSGCKPPAEPHIGLPGMPAEVEDYDHNRIHTPGLKEMDGAVWVTWKVAPAEEQVRLDMWARVPLSVYHAARERRQDNLEAGRV